MRRFVVSAFLSVLLVVLAVSCNMTGTRVSERQNLTINPKIVDISTASLVPTSPTPSKLRFELWREGKEEVTKTLDYAGQGSSYVIEDVLVGTYSVYVYGLDADDKEIMKGGPVSFTVKPNSSNSCKVDLDFLSEKYGSVAVKITWDSSELSDSPISEAIESGRIGFLGFFGSGEYKDKTLKGDTVDESSAYNLIHWVENAAADEFLYKESSVPSTGSAGADAYFIIYTYDEDNNVIALAKTFYTTLIVYDNLESIPDANEVYNFHIDSSTIEGYISNVSASTVTAEPDPSSPVDTLIVSWDNPVFSSDIYPITVNVWLTDKSNRIMGSKQSFVYANKDAASDRGSAKFSQLSSSEKYDVWFSVEGAIGYSKEEIKLENVNPKISVQSIAFPKGFASAYTAGQRIQIEPVFTPTEATVRDFTVKEKANSDDISFDGANVTFDHAGSYTLVITSMDNSEASAEHPVTVRLGKPSSVSAEAENDGIVVSWTPVADADGYAITRTSEDGSSVDFMPGAVSEYKDMAVLSGEKYTYSVKAIKNNDNEGLYTGDAEISTEVSTPEAGIQVSIPGIVTADFSSVLDALVNEYMDITDPKRDSISVGFTGEVTDSNGNNAENYTWKLNGNLLKSGDFSEAGTLTLSYEEYEAAFHLGSDDNVNYLTVEVRLAGQTPRTSTVAFHVLKGNPGTIIGIADADDDGRVVYNSADNRTEKLTLNLSGNTIEPLITWSIADDDKDIASIDANGNLTVLKSGIATVNAIVNALGDTGTATAEIQCYVPVTEITLSQPSNNRLIISKDGVTVSNSSYSSISFDITMKGSDNLIPTMTVDQLTMDYDTGIIDVSTSGKNRIVTPKSAGSSVLKISSKEDNVSSNELIFNVHDLHIYINDLNTDVTGHDSYEIAGGVFSDKRYNLYVRTSNISETVDTLPFFTKWCMADKEGADQPLNYNTTVSTNSPGIWLKVEGSGWDGAVIRASNTDVRNVGVIISDVDGEIAQVFFQTKSTI